MKTLSQSSFNKNYQTHLKHLRVKGLQPKTIQAYSRAIRRIGDYFDHQINNLSEQQLLDYFSNLLDTHSWSTVKLDLYGLKFFYTHVLHKRWEEINLIKPPKTQRLPEFYWLVEEFPIVKKMEDPLKRKWSYWAKGNELCYYFDDHPDLLSQIQILENNGLVREITYNNVQRYIMSEEFAQYLAD